MIVVLGSILLAVVIGLVSGGRIGNLASVHIRWPLLAVAGLALQIVPTPAGNRDLPFLLLMLSFVLLFAFGFINVRRPGFMLILIGLSLNALVIGVNHGMPVARRALVASDQAATLSELERSGGAKHHLAGPGDNLMFLADMIPIGPPVRQILSTGDVLTFAGVMWFVVATLRSREPAGPPGR
jgi:hypothetical protein